MAGQIEKHQIVRLARCMSPDAMASIALGYLGIEQETIDSLREDANGTEAFNRSIIRNWMYRNSGPSQVKVSLIYKQLPIQDFSLEQVPDLLEGAPIPNPLLFDKFVGQHKK